MHPNPFRVLQFYPEDQKTRLTLPLARRIDTDRIKECEGRAADRLAQRVVRQTALLLGAEHTVWVIGCYVSGGPRSVLGHEPK
jgi:hypothetical protein